MVNNATSYSGSGLRDWLLQRVTAVVLAVYTLFMLGYIVSHHHIDYTAWRHFFAYRDVKVFTLLALLSLAVHAWIGIWTVLTDYVKVTFIRVSLEIIVALGLLIYLFWGIDILWSV